MKKNNKLFGIDTGLILVLIVLFFAQNATAQDIERNFRVGLGFGGSFGGYLEETDSSINRYYSLPSFFLDSNIEKGDFLHHINLGFFRGENTVARRFEKKYSPPRYYSIRANIEYALDYRLWSIFRDDKFPGYIGGNFRTDAFILSETMEIAKITAILSLGVHATQKWIINPQHSLTLSAGLPIFGYAVRPPYTGIDELFEKYTSEGTPVKIFGTGRFASIHNYWALFADLKYHFQLIDLISLNAGLGFELSRVNFPAPKIDAVTRLTAGIAFTF